MIGSLLLKRLVIIFIVLSSASLYTLMIFPESIRNMVELAGVGIILIFLIIDLIYDHSERLKQHFRTEVYLFLLATFLSMFVANAYHQQSFSTTLLVQRYMYFYFFYFLLHSYKMDAEDIERFMIPLGLLYVLFYLLQYIAFPVKLFDSRVVEARGTIRIFIPGASFMWIAYFKSLQQYFTSRKGKFLIICIVFFLVGGILQGTRQSFARIVIMTLAFIFFNKEVKSKTFIISLAGIAGFALFLLFQEIIMEFISLTQRQTTSQQPNIRILAAIFFMTDFMPANIAYILGNGQDSMNEAYGLRIYFYRVAKGFHQSDIGLIGSYSRFGVLFVIAQLSVLAKLIFGKIHPKISYIRYYFISLPFVMFSGTNMFDRPDGIVTLVITLYIVDYYRNLKDNEKKLGTE